jgi:predicted PhzF superfamily epimerase YddE/YHI9
MRIFTVDSFTDKPFTGNPAGVCILENDCNLYIDGHDK